MWRLRGRTELDRVRHRGVRAAAGPVAVTWLESADDDPPKVAFAVGRRSGGAVVRNRIRRRLRAVLADARVELRSGSWLVTAGPSAADLPADELRASVATAVAAAGERRS